MAKTKIGHMPCPDCGERVAVKENEHGTLSYSCPECDGSGYCRKTEARHPMWEKKITRLAKPEPDKKEAKEPPPPPGKKEEPGKSDKRDGFLLG